MRFHRTLEFHLTRLVIVFLMSLTHFIAKRLRWVCVSVHCSAEVADNTWVLEWRESSTTRMRNDFTSSMTCSVFSKNMEIALISVLKCQRRSRELTHDSFLDSRNGEICKIVRRLTRTVIWRVSCCWFESTETYKKSTQQLTKMTVKISTEKQTLCPLLTMHIFLTPNFYFHNFCARLETSTTRQSESWVAKLRNGWEESKVKNCCIIKLRI